MASSRKSVSVLDQNFEEVCMKWYDELGSDVSDAEDEETCISSDHETERKQKDNEENVTQIEESGLAEDQEIEPEIDQEEVLEEEEEIFESRNQRNTKQYRTKYFYGKKIQME